MKNKISLITIILLFIAIGAEAQFLTKVSIGLKSGINFTIPNASTQFSVFENVNAGENAFDKNYNPFYQNLGTQYAFLFYYAISKKSYISFQPSIYNYSFKYENIYNWTGNDNTLNLTNNFKHNLQYLDLPLLFKYEFTDKKFQPYAQGGLYYGLLLNSTSYITKTETGDFGTFEYEKEALGSNKNFITSNIGILAGLAITYHFKRSKFGIETNFRYGFHNITDTQNRYSNSQITGKYYDIQDDLKLMNLSLSLVYSVSLQCLKKTIPPSHREF